MLYQLTDIIHKSMFHPMSAVLGKAHKIAASEYYPLKSTTVGKFQSALFETGSLILGQDHKLGFNIKETSIDGVIHDVNERVLVKKPFGHLVHFETQGCEKLPRILIVSALSGHHATLSRETYAEFLPEHDVYVTDWQCARNVPIEDGDFGFEQYIRYIIDFLEYLGPDVHVVGLCQAGVPVLTAAAVMSKQSHACKPRSITLMASPVDVRVNPNILTRVSKIMNKELQRRLTIHTVPSAYPGAGRRVYPGLNQLFGFVSLSFPVHVRKHIQFFKSVCDEDKDAVEKHREFYEEYYSVLDMPEEFYLETLERVFFDQHLPKGKMKFEGEPVSCDSITDIPLMTIEGAKDNMCSLGMTAAAHDLCRKLPKRLHASYIEPDVGHYGVFSGSKFRANIAPQVKKFISRSHNARRLAAA